jgi:hypothetical protein
MKKGLLVFAFGLISFCDYSQTTYNENMGTVAATTAIAAHESANGFGLTAFTYSGTGDVRNTTNSSGYAGASGGANVFLTNVAGRDLVVSNFTSSTGCANPSTLSFGIFKNINAESGSTFLIEYSTSGSGGPWTSVGNPTLPTGAGTSNWRLVSGFSIPSNAVAIRFSNTGTTTQFRVDDISITTGVGCTLPVTYTSIQARSLENNIELAWGTSSEVGAEKFEIERSNNALEFYKIGQVTAQGESRSKLNYSFIDNSPIEGINYYRLKQIDLDGKYEYSKIVSATFGKEAEALEILGNPTQSNKITLLLKNLPIEQLKLFSTTGQNIPFDSSENDNRLTIQPKSNLSSGIYYLVLRNTTQQYFRRLVIE